MGGNFCAEEIETFTRRVEATNRRVDDVEGDVLAGLEVAEKQQQDSLQQLTAAFEDKFRYHLVDMGFAEKLQRALCHIQVALSVAVCVRGRVTVEIITAQDQDRGRQ